jgi:predicted flap endonuclease-1-like 5' DNA nuclease
MGHYILEVAVWVLLAFFIGCLVGYLLRGMFGSKEETSAAEPVKAPYAPTPVSPVATVEAEPAPAPVAEAPPVAEPVALLRMERPRGLDAPRGGKADELQRISGIGPKNEKILHTLGFFHFDQIAVWSAEQVAWVDDHLKFNGRIGRERWIEQSVLLAAGRDEEFRQLFGSGGLKNAGGVTEAGSETRRS